MSNTDKYSFFNINPEPLLHLFYEYKIIRDIWNGVVDRISSKFKIPLGFRPSEILFGWRAKIIKKN